MKDCFPNIALDTRDEWYAERGANGLTQTRLFI